MKYNKQTSKKDKNQRESNIPTKKQSFSNLNKVNNGVFVFTKSLTVGELAKELNVNASDIIKKLFLQKKLVTINNYLDDETIGEICLEFGYDFKKQEIVNEEDFEKLILAYDYSVRRDSRYRAEETGKRICANGYSYPALIFYPKTAGGKEKLHD